MLQTTCRRGRLATRMATLLPLLLWGTAAASPGEESPRTTQDPATANAEPMPRASRALLLDVRGGESGFFAVGERGHILSSSDGEQWRQLQVPTRSTLTAVAGHGPHLWAAGHDGVIVHSANGGDSWRRQRVSPWSAEGGDDNAGVPVLDLLFLDAHHGIAIGAYNLLLRTEDGGENWVPRSPQIDAVSRASEGQAAADWSFDESDLQLGAELDPHLNAIARTGSGALVIAGERGTFLRSIDGGAQWESRMLPYLGSMFGILAWEDQHILVYGLRGNVLESRDLGDTWQDHDTGIVDSLLGGVALDRGGAVLVGVNGAVLYRPDADTPFRALRFQRADGVTPTLTGVLPLGANRYLLIGDKGVDAYQIP